jgi:hypothetical protein
MVRGLRVLTFLTSCFPPCPPRSLCPSQPLLGYPLCVSSKRESHRYASVKDPCICCARHCEWLPSRWSPGFIADARSVLQLSFTLLASAETITIVVGGNGTNNNAGLIFQPQEVKAAIGDIVVFNCTSEISTFVRHSGRAHPSTLNSSVTNGTHSAVESTFAEPCIPAHESNITLNGFDSGLRDTVNGSAQTTLTVEIQQADQNKTFWFYDIWGCGQGGVGAINANDSDWENFEAFVRNAKRLNGSSGGTSSSFSLRPTSSLPVPTSTTTGNSATTVGVDAVMVISILGPFFFTMFAIQALV